ncbi:SRPBCC family protein [Cryobacterium melibiosiphilum]|nr:SRPBCC family protein [Cryobacterium melibiosiphilum]
MAGFSTSEWIARAPNEVFDFITNPNNAPKVMESVQSMVALTEGPLRVGTRYRETRLMRGKEERAELEVVGYEPHRRYAVKNVTEGFDTVYDYAFRAEATGTRVDLVCTVTTSGAKRLMLPVVTAVLKKEDGDHLLRLKKALDA